MNSVTNSSSIEDEPLSARVTSSWPALARAERAVARHLAAIAPQDLLLATADSLASATSTSDATVVRTVRKLGYDGIPALKQSAGDSLRDRRLPHVEKRIELSHPESGVTSLAATVRADADERMQRTIDRIDIDAYATAVDAIIAAETVYCYGWGLSQLGASYLALRLGRIGKQAHAIGATGFELAEKLMPIKEGSTLVVFAPGRHLPELDFLIDHARAVHARVALITTSLFDFGTTVDCTLYMASSDSGITAEPLTELVVVDILMLALTAQLPDESRQGYELLTRLRMEALGRR